MLIDINQHVLMIDAGQFETQKQLPAKMDERVY